jgi:hypothetical protein
MLGSNFVSSFLSMIVLPVPTRESPKSLHVSCQLSLQKLSFFQAFVNIRIPLQNTPLHLPDITITAVVVSSFYQSVKQRGVGLCTCSLCHFFPYVFSCCFYYWPISCTLSTLISENLNFYYCY